jgi:hypothetical protein
MSDSRGNEKEQVDTLKRELGIPLTGLPTADQLVGLFSDRRSHDLNVNEPLWEAVRIHRAHGRYITFREGQEWVMVDPFDIPLPEEHV